MERNLKVRRANLIGFHVFCLFVLYQTTAADRADICSSGSFATRLPELGRMSKAHFCKERKDASHNGSSDTLVNAGSQANT